MGLWQLAVMDQVPLAAAQEVKAVTDIDDHSLLLMRAKVVAAATAPCCGSPHRGRALPIRGHGCRSWRGAESGTCYTLTHSGRESGGPYANTGIIASCPEAAHRPVLYFSDRPASPPATHRGFKATDEFRDSQDRRTFLRRRIGQDHE